MARRAVSAGEMLGDDVVWGAETADPFDGFDPFDVTQHMMLNHLIDVSGDRGSGVVYCSWRLIRLGAMRHGPTAGLDTWLRGQGWPVVDPAYLEDEAADEAIRRLGQWLRRISPVEGADGGS